MGAMCVPEFYGATFAVNNSQYLNYLTLSNANVNGAGNVTASYSTTLYVTNLADAYGSTWSAGLTLAGNVQFIVAKGTAADDLTISGNVVNSNGGGVTKTGLGTLLLSGTDTYIGNTTINGGTLALSGPASIANTPVITLAGGSTLDVSGLSSPFVLGGSQTLQGGSGIANVVGTFQDSGGSTIIPGGTTNVGTINFGGDLTLAGCE